MAETSKAANASLSDVHLLPYEMGSSDTEESAVSTFESLLSDEEETSESSEPATEESDEDEPVDDESDESEEDDEDEEESEEDDEDEEQDEEKPDTAQKYKTKVNGEEVEVTLEELLSGYSRTADYTRKTQEVAEQRKAVQAEAEQTRATREQYAQRLQVLSEALEHVKPPETDWAKLREENPTEFAVQWAEHQQFMQQQEAVRAEQTRVFNEQQAEAAKLRDAQIDAEFEKLTKALPEWGDEVKRAEAQRKLAEYAQSAYGYGEDDLGNVIDHRILVILEKSRRYDELQRKADGVKDKRKSKDARTLKPGGVEAQAQKPEVRANKAKMKRLEQKQRRLAQTGSARDAAAVFEDLL